MDKILAIFKLRLRPQNSTKIEVKVPKLELNLISGIMFSL